MDYAKYSKQAFESFAVGSPELSLLVSNLKDDVNLALHAALHAKFKEIVSSLNEVGHSLIEHPQSKAGEIDFGQIESDERHVFYLCCDTIICSGYRGTPDYTYTE